MYKYKIFKEQSLISCKLVGTFCFDDILNLRNEVTSDPDFKPHFVGFSDERNADIVMNRNEIQQLVDLKLDFEGPIGRWAHLINSPRSAATAYEYQRRAKGIHEASFFSSIEATQQFLGIEDLKKYLLK